MALTVNIGFAVKVEIFGTPRLAAGRREVELVLAPGTSRQEFTDALAEACPPLIGTVIRDDRSGLQEGFVLNRNGLVFLSGDAFDIRDGDAFLILSNQAGG